MSPRPKIRALVIGAGAPTASSTRGGGHQIGYTHASSFLRNPRVELVGAADINPLHLGAFLTTFAGPEGFVDYRMALATIKPDLVSICTYVGLHREIVEACLEYGVRGILCEKPFVNSPRELVTVERALKNSSCRLAVAHVRRYLPAYQKARELVRDGAIGRLVFACVGLDGWDLSEMGSHYFDLIRMFFGDQPIRHVFGQARVRSSFGYGHTMEDQAMAYFEFDSGGRGLIDGGNGLPFILQGDRGSIVLESEQTFTLVNRDGCRLFDYSQDPGSSWDALWDRTLEEIVAWMDGGPEPETGLTNSARSAEVNLAAYVSALRGDRTDLPLDDDLDEWPVDAIARVRSSGRTPVTTLTN